MKEIFDQCIYSIRLPWRLVEASRDGTSLREGRRWVTGQRMLRQAHDAGQELPVLFADSRDCSKLIAWSVLKSIRVGESSTYYKIGKLWALKNRRPQDLRLHDSGKRIAADFIRPYALCRTPEFLKRAAQSPHPYRYGNADSSAKQDVQRRAGRLDVKAALRRAWPAIVSECRSVLGSELHYQAMVYHCLRTAGRIPVDQLGMNVKMWIDEVRTKPFRQRDPRKNPQFRGGFEPIPDVVVFSRGIRRDWRRRNNAATLQHMIGAIEIKASERAKSRLHAKEIFRDIEKIAAHRLEKRHKWSKGFFPAVMIVDTAPEKRERISQKDLDDVLSAARVNRVAVYYLSKDKAIPDVTS